MSAHNEAADTAAAAARTARATAHAAIANAAAIDQYTSRLATVSDQIASLEARYAERTKDTYYTAEKARLAAFKSSIEAELSALEGE